MESSGISMNDMALEIEKLSRDERLDLLERIWESLRTDPADVPLTEAQARELDRRLDRIEREGPVGVPWEDVQKELEASEQ
jgi:putative addiction module component (TIGR02574 family)